MSQLRDENCVILFSALSHPPLPVTISLANFSSPIYDQSYCVIGQILVGVFKWKTTLATQPPETSFSVCELEDITLGRWCNLHSIARKCLKCFPYVNDLSQFGNNGC